MFVVLAEDDTDFQTFKVIIRRLLGDAGITIKGRGYDGCGDMLNKGARFLAALNPPENFRCIVVHDCDGVGAEERQKQVVQRIFAPAKVRAKCGVVVPKEEVEAWILADLDSLSAVIPNWKSPLNYARPEEIRNPKEQLHRLARDAKSRPRITEANNPKLASALRLDIVASKCPSFQSLVDVVCHGKANV